MSTRTVSVQEAEKHLAELIGLAAKGDEIVIAGDDQARVKLVPVPRKANKRVFGQHRGYMYMGEDFDAPLPEDFWLGWPSVKLLLDTHTFLWLDSEPEKLSATALAACEDPDNELYFSVVSAWEIQIKAQLGRLTLHVLLEDMVEVQQTDSGLFILPVELRHVFALDTLPRVHHDPFDRLLVAQQERNERTW